MFYGVYMAYESYAYEFTDDLGVSLIVDSIGCGVRFASEPAGVCIGRESSKDSSEKVELNDSR